MRHGRKLILEWLRLGIAMQVLAVILSVGFVAIAILRGI